MTICSTMARGARMRLTRLDECGVPVSGASSVVTTSGFVSVGVSPVYRDPDEIEIVNANAELCITDRTCPQFKWLELEMEFCSIDPDAWNIITGDVVPSGNWYGTAPSSCVPSCHSLKLVIETTSAPAVSASDHWAS